MPGLILAAPSSGSGKTTITLGLLRALRNAGHPVRAAKSGPDYIDPRFHRAACGQDCVNLDAWAMRAERIKSLAAGPELLIIEGAMGLFDGAAPDGKGATADLARILGLPVVLIIDAARMAQSIAAIVAGFAGHDPKVQIAGVVLNRVGSAKHERMLRQALAPIDLPILGVVHRQADLSHPSRHLGLVQADEHPDLEAFLEQAAGIMSNSLDLTALQSIAQPLPAPSYHPGMPPPAQRIAIAQDHAFAFAYPHLLGDWRKHGAEILPFSPLADDPVPPADMVFLPGGYPELHAARLASNHNFMQSLKIAAQETIIYGECGGYMLLGDGLIDANGDRHEMAGLLPLETSFATRKLHLGYRNLIADSGPFKGRYTAHEFHYATTLKAQGKALFTATDSEGTALPPMGLHNGNVSGSFAHIIDSASG